MRAPKLQHQFLREVVSCCQKGRALVLNCRTSRGSGARVKLTPLAAGVLRFQMIPEGVEEDRSIMPVKEEWPAVEHRVRETETRIVVDTEALKFLVEKSPWMFAVRDNAGRLICRDCPEDVDAHGNRRSLLMGWAADSAEVKYGTITFALAEGEHLYGLGEKFTPLDKVGQTIKCWNVNPYGSGTEEAYKNIPFLVSSRGYGIFLNSTYASTWYLGSRSTVSYSIHCEDPKLDLFLIYGPSLKEVISSYTEITGRPPVPPKWSFGSTEAGLKSDGRFPADADELVKEVCEAIRKEKLPCDVIQLGPPWMTIGRKEFDIKFDPKRVPDPEDFVARVGAMGFKVQGYLTPYIPTGSAMYEEGKERGYLVKRRDGSICEEHLAWPFPERYEGDSELTVPVDQRVKESFWRKRIFEGELIEEGEIDHIREVERSDQWRVQHRESFYIPGAFVDFTNHDAAEWWQDKVKAVLELGVACFMTDFGEEPPLDAVYHNGRTGRELYNYYTTLYQKASFDAFGKAGKKGFVVARSGYAGVQRYPTCWPGDPCSTFGDMRCVLRAGLSIGLSGVAFWMNFVGPFGGKPSNELYIRWLQASVFSSHVSYGLSRIHDERTVEVIKECLRLRYRLIPYVYSYAHLASNTGLPVMRAMILDYGDDPRVYGEETQYMFGEEMLVAPVLSESHDGSGTVSRTVYLPKGRWVDFWTDEVHEGPKNILYEASLDTVPVFVRMDSIVPMGPDMEFVGQKEPDPITLNIYLDGRASFTIYDDDEVATITCAKSPGRILLQVAGSSGSYVARFVGIRGVNEVISCGNVLKRLDVPALEDAEQGWSVDDRGNTLAKFKATEDGVTLELQG